MRPAGLEATLAALRDLEEERRAVERQWQLRLEQARYETRLARRQYDAVDPDNRLVARELERRWEAALAEVERLEQDHERMRRTELRPLEPAEMADVRRLAADLPALWHADTTLPVDRKRLLRLVIAAVTVTVAGDRRAAEVVILWGGGTTTRHNVIGCPFGWHLRTEAEVLALVRDFAEKMPDHQVAAALAGLGLRTRHRKVWTRARVASMRRQHGIPTACPTQTGHQTCRADGLVPARVAGERLGMTLAAIQVWAHRGILACDQSSPSAKLWVRLTPADMERVSGEADVGGLPRVREVAVREGVAPAEIWARVRLGELVAYRAPRGRNQWEWRLAGRTPPNAARSSPAPLLSPPKGTA